MEIRFESVDENTRRIYERFFFERICSMSVASRQDFTIPLLQVEGLYFTSVQDTVERLTELSGRVSTFQWRNCIFAPISRSTKPKEIYAEIFRQLKSKIPCLFVRSYVYLIFMQPVTSCFHTVRRLRLSRTQVKHAKDSPLIRALGLAYYWQWLLDEGKYRSLTEIAAAEGMDRGQVSRTARLTRLAPEIFQSCLTDGRGGIKLEQLVRVCVSGSWVDQRAVLKSGLQGRQPA